MQTSPKAGYSWRRFVNASCSLKPHVHSPEPLLSAWSAVKSWALQTRPICVVTPALLYAYVPFVHLSAPVRRSAVADARIGLVLYPICFSSLA